MVRAVYTDDDVTLNRLRLKAEVAGAGLVADAYYTAFVLAGETAAVPPAEIRSQTKGAPLRASTLGLRTQLPWPGIDVWVAHAKKRQEARNYPAKVWLVVQSQAALNLEFGLREAVRSLGLDVAVNSNDSS